MIIPCARSDRRPCLVCCQVVHHKGGQPSERHILSPRHQRALLAEAPPANDGRPASWPPPPANDQEPLILPAFVDVLYRPLASALSAARGPTSSCVEEGDHLAKMRRGVAALGADEEGRAA